MGDCIHDKLYSPQPNVSMVDLINTKQPDNEFVANFLEKLRQIKSKCNVQFPKVKYGNIIDSNMSS